MPHPVCGQCHSAGAYIERDPFDGNSIVCPICGNRHPGGKGFYMSDKDPLNDHQSTLKREEIMEDETFEEQKPRQLCTVCKAKPTISDSAPYCASCMAKKGNEKRRQMEKTRHEKPNPKKMKEDKQRAEKTPQSENMKVVIDFGDYPSILNQVVELAKDQIRPIDGQIIFILKSHFNLVYPVKE